MNLHRPRALRIYGALFEALSPLWRWWLKRRLQQGKETPTSLDQRWMRHAPARPQGTLVWGHAVGVGEALALAGLLKRLHEQRPDLHFLITTTARTSGEALARQQLGPHFIHWFAPVDTPSNVAKFLAHWQPDLALWCEMDLWPALIDATAQRGTRHVLVNARLNGASAAKRRWGRALYAPLLAGFDAIWAQNAETAGHLQALGAQADRVEITGTIKAMVPPPAADTDELQRWHTALGSRAVWVLASSHPGEEELALAVHALLRRKYPDALLVLVPRDAGRGPMVATLCGPATPLRSQGARLPTHAACYVADTMGELGLWYRLSRVAMVGGSWVPVGGHNPYEATTLGNTVLHGPLVHNFSESYADLDAQGLSVLASSPESLSAAVREVWAATEATGPQRSADGPDNTERSAVHIAHLLALLPATNAP
ncbi:3-deoxy-D-manno-octulosonic acid transferase [Hydrogenophaga sp.]|uniref:3-deoxy-D-manno-octulosonic acid transferase n=1 Tax=Hydrogenophaga sp. TaxID=1904254 RepID=UPI003F6CFC53